MVRADAVRPTARVIAQALGKVTDKEFFRWHDFKGDRGKDDFDTLKQERDDKVVFRRKTDRYARMDMYDITPDDLQNIKVSNPVTLKSKTKRTAYTRLTNDTDIDQEQEVSYQTISGKDIMNEIKAGFEATSTTTVGASGYGVEVSQELSATVSSEFTRQTNVRDEESKTVTVKVVVPARTVIDALVEWKESTIQRHITADATFNYKVRIGKRAPRGKGWRWSGDYTFNSKEELAQSLMGKGSVKHLISNYFYRHKDKRPSSDTIKKILMGPHLDYDQVITYKDADDIHVDYNTVKTL